MHTKRVLNQQKKSFAFFYGFFFSSTRCSVQYRETETCYKWTLVCVAHDKVLYAVSMINVYHHLTNNNNDMWHQRCTSCICFDCIVGAICPRWLIKRIHFSFETRTIGRFHINFVILFETKCRNHINNRILIFLSLFCFVSGECLEKHVNKNHINFEKNEYSMHAVSYDHIAKEKKKKKKDKKNISDSDQHQTRSTVRLHNTRAFY